MARPMTAARTRSARAVSSTLLLALLAACAAGPAGTAPGTAPATAPGAATPAPAPTGTATTAPPAVSWEPADVPGYERSGAPPAEGVVELTDPVHACVVQLTHEPLHAQGDDAAATDRALDETVAGLDPVGEVTRGTGTLTSDHGPVGAGLAEVTVADGSHRMDVRLLLRAVTDEDLLIGIVHICPTGSLDDDVWQAFVTGSTVSGTDAGAL